MPIYVIWILALVYVCKHRVLNLYVWVWNKYVDLDRFYSNKMRFYINVYEWKS